MKSNHKHDYHLVLTQYKPNDNFYTLIRVCSVCGKEKPVNYKLLFIREGSYHIMLTTKEQFRKVYGDLPVREFL